MPDIVPNPENGSRDASLRNQVQKPPGILPKNVQTWVIAGLSVVPHELREAARIDGANEWQVYTRVVIPQLKPVTFSLVIILGHISLKIFDLVFAMTGAGPGFATDVPGIFVFEQTFKAIRYNTGAAASIVMLFLVAIVIIPYLWRTLGRVR